MNVSIPLVAILGAVVWVAWRYMGLRLWHAVAAFLFGLFVAATDNGPNIREMAIDILHTLTGSQP